MLNKLLLIFAVSLLGNCIIAGDGEKITFKRLDSPQMHPDNIVYSYNQAVDFIKKHPTFPNMPFNQQNINNFLQGPVRNFLEKNNLTQWNVNRFIIQNCMVNQIHFSNILNKNYLDGDTALLVTINSKNFVNMDQVIEECLKHQIDIRNVVVLDITNNEIEKITAEELGQFINLQALVAHNNKIKSIDIAKNPYLSILACQNNNLTEGLNLMKKIKQSETPCFINLLDNVFDNMESERIVRFINVSEEMLKSDAQMISFYGSKQADQPTIFLPIMAYRKDEKHSLDFLKIAHIQTAEDRSLIELLVHNKAIVQNYIINTIVPISNFRNLFKKHYHSKYNYLRNMSYEFKSLPPATNEQGKNLFFSIAFLLKSTIVLILIGGITEFTSGFISAKVTKFFKNR